MSRKAAKSYPALLDASTGELHSLAEKEIFLAGRSQEADMPLLDVSCSRRQFQITRQQNRWLLENLAPRDSTLHQGQKVGEPVELLHGSVIQVGPLTFRFVTSDVPTASPARDIGRSQSLLAEATQAPPPSGDRTVIGPATAGSTGTLSRGGQSPSVVNC